MRYLVLSDIHGNIQALDAVMEEAGSLGFDAVLCLGDLVGYGADPAAVISRTRRLDAATLIRGNHDKVCAGLEPFTTFNAAARRAAVWTMSVLSVEEMNWLGRLPRGPVRVNETIEICHGAPFNEDYYVFDENDAARAARSASSRICLFGHTHVPAIFAAPEHPVESLARSEEVSRFRLPAEGQSLVNVGSVGQPRDGDPRAAYGLLDADLLEIDLRRVAYDVVGAQDAIRRAGLPAWLADRLDRGA